MIANLWRLGLYRHPPPVLSGFVKRIALEIGGATHHAADQAGVFNHLPDNGPRLIIGARRADRDSREWRCSSKAEQSRIRVTLSLGFSGFFGPMSDFNFSYSVGSPPTLAGEPAPLWSFNSTTVLPCIGNTVTLHNSRNNQSMLVQSEVAHALNFCAPFRSLDAHLEHILAAMPPLRDNPEDARNILTSIRDAGFLEPAEAAWHRLCVNVKSHESTPARIFILTCDRPKALKRLLDSLCDRRFDPTIESLWVVDDSRQAESLKRNTEVIRAVRGRIPVPVHHVDAAMQQVLNNYLLTSAPQHQTSLSFLLDADRWSGRPTFGRARNVSLLLSVGFRAMVLDDDILLQAIAPPYATRGLKLDSARGREAAFYGSLEALAQHALDTNHDPLTQLLGNVGQSLGNLMLKSLAAPADLAGWDGELLSRYDAQSTVLLNQCGSWGDPGTGDASWIFFLPEKSIKSLISSEQPLEHLLAVRANWMGYRGPTLSAYGSLSQLTGIDHRALLPPYFPVGRGEDALFGIMLQRVQPNSPVLSEGWAIRHEPLDNRADRGDLKPLRVKPDMSTLADWLGREPEVEKGLTPARRLLSVSDDIKKLALLEINTLERLVGERIASKRTSLLARCTEHMEQLSGMDISANATAWSEFLSQSQAGLIEALQSPEPAPLGSLFEGKSMTTEASVREMGDQFADALLAWPEICEVSKDFRPD